MKHNNPNRFLQRPIWFPRGLPDASQLDAPQMLPRYPPDAAELDHMTDRHHHMRFLHMTNRRRHMRLLWVCLSWISHDRPLASYTYMYVQVLFSVNVLQSM